MNLSRKYYSDLILYPTIEERFEYLKIGGSIGIETFGTDRYLNQILYNSTEWRRLRDKIIVRDLGCDLGLEGFEIHSKIIIHHLNPITVQDVIDRNPDIFNPENLITTCIRTHNAIHYGDADLLPKTPIIRRANDMCPWKQ